MGLLNVKVKGIAIDKEREHPVVMLATDDRTEVLPIWIGPAEATAIYTALSGSSFERPMTHDLLKIVVEELGARIVSIEIGGLQKDTYFARIVLQREEDVFFIDARPSDSIALALRAGASIFVDEDLFLAYSRNLQVGKEGEDDVKRHLESLDPSDFGQMDGGELS
ncbi:MAG: bifunctional nuclease family protein [Bacteroidales bacterium]|nr:bifunctional nuclease family protein [Candidatus Latescibacterota bacterium]